MDLLSQHEAFLRAIFDAPDDTPRLVYADFLQENGDEDRAGLIRAQCEIRLKKGVGKYFDRLCQLAAREWELVARVTLGAKTARAQTASACSPGTTAAFSARLPQFSTESNYTTHF